MQSSSSSRESQITDFAWPVSKSESLNRDDKSQGDAMPELLTAQFSRPQNFNSVLMPSCQDSDSPFVSIFVSVDMAHQIISVPEQILSYQTAAGQSLHASVGPTQPFHMPLADIALMLQNASLLPMCSLSAAASIAQTSVGSHVPQFCTSVSFPPTINAEPANSVSALPSVYKTSQQTASTDISRPSMDATAGFHPELPPLPPLSAYNFFFRDERDRIIHGGVLQCTSEHEQEILHKYWYQDRTKRRKHRKVQGCVDFSTLSKKIAQRWRTLSSSEKQFFRRVAAKDYERSKQENRQRQTALEIPMFGNETLPETDTFAASSKPHQNYT